MLLAMTTILLAADPAVDQARKHLTAKKYDEAIAVLEPAYKKNPKSAEVTKALADAIWRRATPSCTTRNCLPG